MSIRRTSSCRRLALHYSGKHERASESSIHDVRCCFEFTVMRRQTIGIHRRMDGQEGLLLGEMICVRIQQQVIQHIYSRHLQRRFP